MKKILSIIAVGLLLTTGLKYKSYIDYKEGLINNNSKEVYLLMNEEAGINSEVESFIHYAIYKI